MNDLEMWWYFWG